MDPARGLRLDFSTEDLPERDRVPVFREVLGRQLLRVDIEPLRDVPFRVEARVATFPGLNVMSGITSGGRVTRSREFLADGDDDLFFGIGIEGSTSTTQRGRDAVLRNGDAVVSSYGEPATTFYRDNARFVALKVPRALLAPLVTNIDDAIMRTIPADNTALKLLRGYLGLLSEHDASATPELVRLAVSHVHDLLAVAIGATRDAAAAAEGRGLYAARLRAIKADILEQLERPGLTPGTLAGRHHISESYMRKLFASDGTSFSDFVLDQRLARAHRLLSDPRFFGRTIVSIAYQVGFGDLSYFNRCFRRRYGRTPSDVRAAAQRGPRS